MIKKILLSPGDPPSVVAFKKLVDKEVPLVSHLFMIAMINQKHSRDQESMMRLIIILNHFQVIKIENTEPNITGNKV